MSPLWWPEGSLGPCRTELVSQCRPGCSSQSCPWCCPPRTSFFGPRPKPDPLDWSDLLWSNYTHKQNSLIHDSFLILSYAHIFHHMLYLKRLILQYSAIWSICLCDCEIFSVSFTEVCVVCVCVCVSVYLVLSVCVLLCVSSVVTLFQGVQQTPCSLLSGWQLCLILDTQPGHAPSNLSIIWI